MCGITVFLGGTAPHCSDTFLKSYAWQRLVENNAARGPDSQGIKEVTIPIGSGIDTTMTFVASTLQLRGATPVLQPHSSENGIFCWNGEVFEGLDFPAVANDGSALHIALDNSGKLEDIINLMSNIEGPYAFVYYQRRTNRLFFARDPLGRRSLLIHRPTDSKPYLILSSTSAGAMETCNFAEVDPRFIYSIDLCHLYDSDEETMLFEKVLDVRDRTGHDGSPLFAKPACVNRTIPDRPDIISISKPLCAEFDAVIDRFIEILDTSVRIQVQNVPEPSHLRPRLAVLFSGGIDSTMIALLASRHIPLDEPIDLLNVAFENPRKLQSLNNAQFKQKNPKRTQLIRTEPQSLRDQKDCAYDVPDRLSGLEELEELRQLCPGRRWNFVEIDVDYADSSQTRKLVEEIMLPSQTVMDLSLALALYFAARGQGKIRPTVSNSSEPYTSPARVLLNGLGSDELLGGYGRHRSAFHMGGWDSLIDELQLELDRLPSRNLGRDDRIISCHGKETRHPFLSLSVVNFVAKLPVHLKVDPRLEAGMGDKMLLRLAARKVGLELASRRRKRAMQFGSHSARMEAGVGDRNGDQLLSAT